jgi:hypothetical protein
MPIAATSTRSPVMWMPSICTARRSSFDRSEVIHSFMRAGAKLRALQLPQQMLQANILRLQVIALRNHGVALGARFQKERLQRCGIGRQRIGALSHANHGIRFARRCDQVMHR